MKKKKSKKVAVKRKKAQRKKIEAPPDLQRAIDAFPETVRLHKRAGKHRLRIMKNFLSVKDKIFKRD